MSFFKDFKLGIQSNLQAFQFIVKHKLYYYCFIPALLMLGIYKIGEQLAQNRFLPEMKTMNDIIWYIFYVMVELSIALLLMKFAKYLVVILLSPLLAHLSQKCERIVTGNKYPFSFSQLWEDVKRGLRIAMRNIMWEYFFFLIIYFIAVLGWESAQSSPVFYLTFIIGFFYYGFSFIDYVNERRRLNIGESILFVRRHRGLAVAIGLVYSFLILMPVDLGKLFAFDQLSSEPIYTISNMALHLVLWACASFAPILAIVSATLAMHELVDLKSNIYSAK